MVLVTPASAGTVKKTMISQNSTCDIVLKDIKTDPIIFRNKTIKVSCNIKNSGPCTSKDFYIDYFLKSSDTAQNIYIGSKHIIGLNPKETRTIVSSFKIPRTAQNTGYYVRVFVDSTNQLNETNKINNVAYSQKKTSIVYGRPVYITCDNIKNNTSDNANVDAIVNSLRKIGLYAKNYGLGPNKHYSILKNVKIPQNALIVNIYGGACAGTIWEMTKPYYKKAAGTRKVFSIWIKTKIDIRTVKFLKRAFDDNVTPNYGKNGGFPNFQDNNNNGKFEPELGEIDGLANPGKILTENGYNFLYQQDGNLEKIVQAIFYQATN